MFIKMKIAVIDDDVIILKIIANFITRYADENNIAVTIDKFTGGGEFLDIFDKGSYDVVFMDVYMDDMNGVQTSLELRKTDNDCRIVFITASDTHMLDAFSCHAFDYIMKPVSKERIFKVMDELLKTMPSAGRVLELNKGRAKLRLSLSKIASILSSGHYVNIRTIGGESYSIRMTFSDIMGMIADDKRFLPVNKGIVVNMEHISEITDGACILANGESYPLKVRDKRAILAVWEEFSAL